MDRGFVAEGYLGGSVIGCAVRPSEKLRICIESKTFYHNGGLLCCYLLLLAVWNTA